MEIYFVSNEMLPELLRKEVLWSSHQFKKYNSESIRRMELIGERPESDKTINGPGLRGGGPDWWRREKKEWMLLDSKEKLSGVRVDMEGQIEWRVENDCQVSSWTSGKPAIPLNWKRRPRFWQNDCSDLSFLKIRFNLILERCSIAS